MPGKIKVKVLAGRNLPVMDRAGDTTDAFVEIKFGGVTHKTDVCRKSLNPHWNSTEWYRFEVEESDLQDEPLQLRLMDHDTYSANDAIGKVVISLAPLLAKEADNAKGGTAHHGGAVMSGWVPVFDTMHGIRGELNLIVKVELFSDFNKYKTSSVGVQFFHCPMIPPGYRAASIHGFVEELVVNDDPEYQWIDKIRTPRASNEARQVAFIKLSNQVQRLVGLKAAELGANAVIGYQQDFDLEGEAGVVARAIGTAVSITPIPAPSQPITGLPYTQQQLKKCLDILATSDENITDLNEYYQTHQEELQKVITILIPKTPSLLDETDTVDDDEKSFEFARQSSVKTYAGNVSIYQDNYPTTKSLKHISEDQTDLNRLLNRDDCDNESIGPLKKIKKLRSSLFSKRRSRINQSGKQDDQISLQSNTSDTSRISLTDIRTEFKKFKRLKKPKLNKVIINKEDEGVGMASILARSVIHAHTSLACIKETQDSENSQGSTLRRTSESEPNLNVSDDDRSRKINPETPVIIKIEKKESKDKSPEIHFMSLNNINTDKETFVPRRKLSASCPTSPVTSRIDNFLKLPGETGYFGSVSSALSGESSTEIYSSSDEDDESSDLKTDTEKSIETTNSVVQTVLSHNVDKNCIQEIDEKLSTLESTTTEPKKKLEDGVKKETKEPLTQSEIKHINAGLTAKSSNHFKFYNPFSHAKANKSESAPPSPVEKKAFGFVHRSSNRIKQQLSKISNNRLIKSLSHYSLIPKKKTVETKVPMSHPNSDSNIRSKSRSHETVLGTPFMSYTDLLSLDTRDKEDVKKPFHKSDDVIGTKVSMYIGSEPSSRASLSGPSSPGPFSEQKSLKKEISALKSTGLIHTAMETILIDKVQSLLIPTSPDSQSKENKFFADVKEKLEKVEENRSDNGKQQLGGSLADKILNKVNKELDSVCKDDNTKSKKRLTRQQSVHSVTDSSDELSKMSEDSSIVIPCKVTHSTPVLQHFHPILSGAPKLETIPSLPESSVDRSLSLEVDEMERKSECDECKPGETNNASVCDNSHAGWPVDRSERERDKSEKDKGSPRHARHESYGNREPVVNTTSAQNASLNATSTPTGIHRRSSDSDLSVTPKGGSLNTSIGNTVSGGGAILRPSMNSNNLDMLEYPFLTMTEYPPEFIVHLGGTVCARSVKLVDGGGESATRAAWWAELRTELRAHARALRCNAVIAYAESAAICEDVCVLSASGTAAVINLDCDFNADENANGSKNTIEESEAEWCSVGHVPYSASSGPYRAELSLCGGCRRARVPQVLLATCAKPARLLSYSKSVSLTAVAARVRRAPPTAEPGARDISDQLPYLEYELHKLLLAKLRMQGANAVFSLQTQVAVGERCVMALASGTAVRLSALPPPNPPRIKATENDKEALEIQKALWETFAVNKAANGYDVGVPEHNANGVLPEVESEEAPALELCADKDACVLELDEAEDVETARALSLRRAHMPVYSGGGARPPPHAFAQVFRARLSVSGATSAHSAAERLVSRALDGITYKLRRLQPCALARPTFQLELPDDEIQLVVSGAAIRLQDPNKLEANGGSHHGNGDSNNGSGAGDADDDIFTLDEEQLVKSSQSDVVEEKTLNGQAPMTVSLTSLCYVSGSRTVRRVCALRLLFVRETTAVRELGGLSGFLHTFTCEVLGIARAYTAALGGNALTSFYVTQLMLQDNAHKNQGQCLLSVGGDVVHVTY